MRGEFSNQENRVDSQYASFEHENLRGNWVEGLSPQRVDKITSGPLHGHLTHLFAMPVQELITNLLDLAIDVPQVWDNLASLVSLLIRLGMTPYEWLQALARQSLPEEPDFIRYVHL